MAKSGYFEQHSSVSLVDVHLDGKPRDTLHAPAAVAVIADHLGVPFLDVAQLEKSLRTAGESNARLREALDLSRRCHKRVTDACVAMGCPHDMDFTVWIRSLHAEREHLRGENDGLRAKLKETVTREGLTNERALGYASEADEGMAKRRTAEATERSLRAEVEGKAALLDAARRDRDELRGLRAADAPLVEAAVAIVRTWANVLPGAHTPSGRRLREAAEAHPAYKSAAPAPEPEPDRCGECGQVIKEATA